MGVNNRQAHKSAPKGGGFPGRGGGAAAADHGEAGLVIWGRRRRGGVLAQLLEREPTLQVGSKDPSDGVPQGCHLASLPCAVSRVRLHPGAGSTHATARRICIENDFVNACAHTLVGHAAGRCQYAPPCGVGRCKPVDRRSLEADKHGTGNVVLT